MNKQIPGIVVAGLFAAPDVALAQSSIEFSGVLKGGFEGLKLDNYKQIGFSPATGGRRAGPNNSSQRGVVDDSSVLFINMREDLGGGLSAIGQLGFSLPSSDDGFFRTTESAGTLVGGNSHIGLRSRDWGRIFIGRQNLHYFNTSGTISLKNSLRADSISLLAYAGAYGLNGRSVNGGTAIAGGTRTQNVVHYTTPNWRGLTTIVAYSSNPIATDSDITPPGTRSIRRGNAWNLQPNYSTENWQVGYSFWTSKPDVGILAPVLTSAVQYGAADQRGHRLYWNYTTDFEFRVGFAWDYSRLEGNRGLNDGVTLSKRTAWSVPLQYSFTDRHHISGHYTWANSDRASMTDGMHTKASMWAVGYAYDLSRQTSVGLTYARINNRANAGYAFFTSSGLGVGGNAGVMAGEDPRMFGTTIRHAF